MVEPVIIPEDRDKIYTTITVINCADQILAAEVIFSEQICDTILIIQDCKRTFEYWELPSGQNNLLAVIPLEALGLEPDTSYTKIASFIQRIYRYLFNDFIKVISNQGKVIIGLRNNN